MDAMKVLLRGKLIALTAYIYEILYIWKSYISYLIIHLKDLEKQEETIPWKTIDVKRKYKSWLKVMKY